MSSLKEGTDPEKISPAPIEFVKYIFITYAGTLLLMGILYASTFGLKLTDEHERWGQFGDFVGGVLNPLTSFFTLLVALLVWSLQKKELAATNLALADQIRLGRIASADSVFDAYIKTIQQHAANFHHAEGPHGQLISHYGEIAIEKATLIVKRKLSSTDLSKVGFDINSTESKFFTRYVEQLSPLVASLAVTCDYLDNTYTVDLKEPRLERIRICLSAQQQLAVIYFVFLTRRTDLKALFKQTKLFKYFPACPQKSWFETEV
jgi:hypothetical protein